MAVTIPGARRLGASFLSVPLWRCGGCGRRSTRQCVSTSWLSHPLPQRVPCQGPMRACRSGGFEGKPLGFPQCGASASWSLAPLPPQGEDGSFRPLGGIRGASCLGECCSPGSQVGLWFLYLGGLSLTGGKVYRGQQPALFSETFADPVWKACTDFHPPADIVREGAEKVFPKPTLIKPFVF